MPDLSDPNRSMSPDEIAALFANMGNDNNCLLYTSAFHSSDALAKYAGLTWKTNQSGDFDGEDTPMVKAGNRYLRYYLGEAANRCV